MISKDVERLFREHVLQEYPKEACGLVVGGCYYPQENIADDPTKNFKISGFPFGDLQFVLHSHPDTHKAVPSFCDMKSQIQTNVPWGIAATDGEWVGKITWFGTGIEKADLIGREFIHGVQDCYALVRDYYKKERNICLPEFPRNDQWWNEKDTEPLLTPNNFKTAGFVEIPYNELKVGDVILGSVLCERVNHCAIYVGDGLVLHHLYNRKSRREPLGPWLKFCKYFLRYQE